MKTHAVAVQLVANGKRFGETTGDIIDAGASLTESELDALS